MAASLGTLGRQLVGDLAPLYAGRGSIFLGECGCDEGSDHAATMFAGMGQQVAHQMHAAALPCRMQHFGDCGFQPFMGIRDYQLDAAQATSGELA